MKLSSQLRWLSVMLALALGFGIANAEARNRYALIVGVTEYPHLPENTWLVGPANDARLLRDFLTTQAGFKPDRVVVLAEGNGAARQPTLANIRSAMAALAQEIRDSGEEAFVYLHFSGHGSQMPARLTSKENDGKDEVFLPADAMPWDKELGGFPNAYVDDDIGEDIRALRAAGAFVWVIFDACHSASATRAADGEVVEVSRRLDPVALGVPRELLSGTTRSLGEDSEARPMTVDTAPELGGLVAFFAAQTVETTPEMPLPRDKDGAERYGLFTYTLLENLARHPGISYRQLGQTILQSYAAMNRRAPTPLFEGELDARVFGVDGEPPVVQWRLRHDGKRATVDAGRVHGLDDDALLALLASAADPLDAAMGYLKVQSADRLTSRLIPVAHNGLEAPSEDALNAGGWVRPAEFTASFELSVSVAGDRDGKVAELVERLAADERQLFRIRTVPAGAPADVALTLASETAILARMRESGIAEALGEERLEEIGASASETERLWFLPASGEATLLPGRRPPSLPVGPVFDTGENRHGFEAQVAGYLTRIYRATNLARMSAASDFRGRVEVTFLIRRDDSGAFEPVEAGVVPQIRENDEIHVRVVNKSSRAIDLNVLHVGTDYSISVPEPVRIERNGEEEIGLFAVNAETVGIERLVAVVTEAMPGSDVQDLRFLAQGGLRSADGEATKGLGDAGGLVQMLHAMGKEAATRGTTMLSDAKGPKGAVMLFQVESVAGL